MLHCILKQHKIHGCIELIVALQGICEGGPECRPVCNRSIEGFLPPLGKVAIEEGLLCHLFVLQFLEEDKHNKSLKSLGQCCYLKVNSSNLYCLRCLSKFALHLKAFMHSLHLELPEELQVRDIHQSV